MANGTEKFVQWAIIHTDTKVILGVSAIQDVKIPETASLIGLIEKLKLPIDQYPDNKYWVLNDDLTVSPASDIQIEMSGVDPAIEANKLSAKVQAYNDSIDKIIMDDTISINIKDYFKKLKELNG